MTITESDLREILRREGEDGLHGGVTVADVDRRARRIRRRRAGVLGGVAALGIVAAAAFALPAAGTATVVPGDPWTGVMAQPSPVLPTVSWPIGDPVPSRKLAGRDYTAAGTREKLQVRAGDAPIGARVTCYGPLRRVLIWVDGGTPLRQYCGEIPGGPLFVGWAEIRKQAREHVVSVAVLPGEVDTAGKQVEDMLAETDELFDGWQERLAGGKEFPLEWSIEVNELTYPPCRDNVRQVDPATGRMVVLRCPEGAGKAADGEPAG
ncbi:hypothetical protein FHR32_000209 [Streptosporangium album]|uniref:Uncharacterized protein n=1 Tax=Streptosporangium album TaxID=47479 RepID=A0A7W7RPP1_9ACTN|nr:hypothetical protein [Streptosporangium album]MBB4935904.1 hypothetical protein [Streptosporangium album]